MKINDAFHILTKSIVFLVQITLSVTHGKKQIQNGVNAEQSIKRKSRKFDEIMNQILLHSWRFFLLELTVFHSKSHANYSIYLVFNWFPMNFYFANKEQRKISMANGRKKFTIFFLSLWLQIIYHELSKSINWSDWLYVPFSFVNFSSKCEIAYCFQFFFFNSWLSTNGVWMRFTFQCSLGVFQTEYNGFCRSLYAFIRRCQMIGTLATQTHIVVSVTHTAILLSFQREKRSRASSQTQ